MRTLTPQELLTALALRQYPKYPSLTKRGTPGSAKAQTVMYDAIHARKRIQNYDIYQVLAAINKQLTQWVNDGWITKEFTSFRITDRGMEVLRGLEGRQGLPDFIVLRGKLPDIDQELEGRQVTRSSLITCPHGSKNLAHCMTQEDADAAGGFYRTASSLMKGLVDQQQELDTKLAEAGLSLSAELGDPEELAAEVAEMDAVAQQMGAAIQRQVDRAEQVIEGRRAGGAS